MAEPNFKPLSSRRKHVGFAPETDCGAAVSVTGAMAGTFVTKAVCKAGSWYAKNRRAPIGQFGGSYPAIRDALPGTLDMATQLCPGDTFVSRLTACGYKAATGVYSPRTDLADTKTFSTALWRGGQKMLMYGASASAMKLTFKAGEIITTDENWMGVWNGVTDASLPANPTWAAPYVCRGITFTVDGVRMPHKTEITIDLGLKCFYREDAEMDAVIHHAMQDTGERAPKLTFNSEARKVADYDVYGLLLAGATAAVEIVLTSGTTTMTITCPAAQRTEVEPGEADGRELDSPTVALCADVGDDEINFEEVNDD